MFKEGYVYSHREISSGTEVAIFFGQRISVPKNGAVGNASQLIPQENCLMK